MTISVIFGGQFGSEGKGLMASYLAKNKSIDLATTDAGPNAGHTAIWDGKKVITFHLPMAGVLSPGAIIWLNGGSIINPKVLLEEIKTFDDMGFAVSSRLIIHPNAAIIEQQDIDEEAAGHMVSISSTMKGVGAAAARKVNRTARTARGVSELHDFISHQFTPLIYKEVVVEVAQGYSLGVNAGFYPYCTHRACTPAQGLMNAGIPTNTLHTVYAVIRANPIRVGNLPNGFSGECYPDQVETTWKALGQEPQFTTVTKRLRRVFTYSHRQINQMIDACTPDIILVNFAQTVPRVKLSEITDSIIKRYTLRKLPVPRLLFGHGPAPEDIR